MKKWLFLMLFAFGIAEVKNVNASTKDAVASSASSPKPAVAPRPSSVGPSGHLPRQPVAPQKPLASDPGAKNNQARDINAGPIFNQAGAQRKCPTVCSGAKSSWTGHWKTTVPGKMSVCNCLPGGADTSKTEAPKPVVEAPKPTTPEAPKPDAQTVNSSLKNISSGPIWNGNHAQSVCPKKCKDNASTWKGVWWTPKETWGRDSICQCVVGADTSKTEAPKPVVEEAPKPTTPEAPKPDATGAKDVEAGPIFNQAGAQQKCPTVCNGAKSSWTGHWKTTVPGKMSVCNCLPSADAPKPEAPKPVVEAPKPTTPEAPKPDASTTAKDVEAGPIFNQPGAEQRCPVVCNGKDKWTGHWKTTVPGKMSVCNCLPGAEAPKPTTPEAPKPDASTTAKDVEAGPIFNQPGAEQRCPVVCNGKDKWTGHWKTTVPGKMSVCNCLPGGADTSKTEAPKPVVEAPKPTEEKSKTEPDTSKSEDNSASKDSSGSHKLNFDEGVVIVIDEATTDGSTSVSFKEEESTGLDNPDRVALEIFADIWDLPVTWENQ